MQKTQTISDSVTSWISEEEFPAVAGLRVLRRNDPNFGMSEEEIEDRAEFVRLCFLRDWEPLLSIPGDEEEFAVSFGDLHVCDVMRGLFTATVFRKEDARTRREGYRFRELLARVRGLALIHSVASFAEGRRNMVARFEGVLQSEFRGRLERLAARLHEVSDVERRETIQRKIQKIGWMVRVCRQTWAEGAAPPG